MNNENLIKINNQSFIKQPMTNLKLLMTDIEIDNKNQLTFTDFNEQINYFSNLPSADYNNFTYQRRDSTIRIPDNIDNLYHFNYCIYQNENYSSKWFFAFITNMEYLNDKTTLITIKTDFYQTWHFDINFLACFIEREHVNDDTPGLHTIPENLETGEYINNSTPIQSNYANNTYICFALTEQPSGIPIPANRNYNGIFSGLIYMIVKDYTSAKNLINYYDNEGKADAIHSIFLIPQSFKNSKVDFTHNDSLNIDYNLPVGSSSSFSIEDITFPKPNSLNGYIPKNNKLLTYPYIYINVSNNNGISAVYNYEDFLYPTFKTYGNIGTGCSIRLIPQNYKNTYLNNEYGISGGKLPTCSWNSDVYTNWLTQNAVNNTVGILETGAKLITNPISTIGNISGLVSSYYEHNLIPNQVRGNTNCADVNFSLGYGDFTFYSMSIKQEYAQIIDDYFSMYGYKINRLKIPNIRGRLNWNYVKTVNANIVGDIPQSDLQELKNMFDSGITLWHHHETFLDYSKNNNII